MKEHDPFEPCNGLHDTPSITQPASAVTPLPNKLEDETWQVAGNLVVDNGGLTIAVVLEMSHAKLIAAAPELLEAIRFFAVEASGHVSTCPCRCCKALKAYWKATQ